MTHVARNRKIRFQLGMLGTPSLQAVATVIRRRPTGKAHELARSRIRESCCSQCAVIKGTRITVYDVLEKIPLPAG